jgi:hypothetical protein
MLFNNNGHGWIITKSIAILGALTVQLCKLQTISISIDRKFSQSSNFWDVKVGVRNFDQYIHHLIPDFVDFILRKIHDVISKNYHRSGITLISRKLCDKHKYNNEYKNRSNKVEIEQTPTSYKYRSIVYKVRNDRALRSKS